MFGIECSGFSPHRRHRCIATASGSSGMITTCQLYSASPDGALACARRSSSSVSVSRCTKRDGVFVMRSIVCPSKRRSCTVTVCVDSSACRRISGVSNTGSVGDRSIVPTSNSLAAIAGRCSSGGAIGAERFAHSIAPMIVTKGTIAAAIIAPRVARRRRTARSSSACRRLRVCSGIGEMGGVVMARFSILRRESPAFAEGALAGFHG